MYYQSTRCDIRSSPARAVLEGLAPDGGLFVCPDIGNTGFDWKKCVDQSFMKQSAMILSSLLPGICDEGALIENAYHGRFESDIIAPTKKLGDIHITELFHGPTSSFKDIALSVLPHLIRAAKSAEGDNSETVILTATSGDTGKAALEGFADVEGTRILVFFPSEGVSAVQKAQMISTSGNNVRVCAVEGNFDDCQYGVKKTFQSIPVSSSSLAGRTLSSANSINIGRLIPQIAYYFSSYSFLLQDSTISMGDEIDFTVPTGNFGDILAGYYARILGLPIGNLICASNSNRVLTDFLQTGTYDRNREFYRTSSPSMDILLSSNLERLLFHSSGNDAEYVKDLMDSLSREGHYSVKAEVLNNIRSVFSGFSADETEVSATIGDLWHNEGYLADPHTAVALSCARRFMNTGKSRNRMVVMSTASPFKFPKTVLSAIGEETCGSDFDLLEKLSDVSGLAIPHYLAGFSKAAVLHKDLIKPEMITDYVVSHLDDWSKTS